MVTTYNLYLFAEIVIKNSTFKVSKVQKFTLNVVDFCENNICKKCWYCIVKRSQSLKDYLVEV